MLRKIANALSEDDDEAVVVEFGLSMFITALIGVVVAFFISVRMSAIVEGIIFILFIMPLRQNAGGFHFQSRWICLIVSFAIYVVVLFIIKNNAINSMIQVMLYLGASTIILYNSPVDTEMNVLDEIEKEVYRRRTFIIWICESCIFMILFIMRLYNFSGIVLLSLCVVALLQGIQVVYKFFDGRLIG